MKYNKWLYAALFTLALFSDAFGNDKKCSGVGESAGGSLPPIKRCCEGLTQTNWWKYKNPNAGCDVPPVPGSGGYCVKCGDGKCDVDHYEEKCTCPQDCK
jgi:hypothetical protein